MKQYQKEERTLIANRVKSAKVTIKNILNAMENDVLSVPENIESLREDLGKHYQTQEFQKAKNMGQILRISLAQLISN
jgi:hypothetical protein